MTGAGAVPAPGSAEEGRGRRPPRRRRAGAVTSLALGTRAHAGGAPQGARPGAAAVGGAQPTAAASSPSSGRVVRERSDSTRHTHRPTPAATSTTGVTKPLPSPSPISRPPTTRSRRMPSRALLRSGPVRNSEVPASGSFSSGRASHAAR